MEPQFNKNLLIVKTVAERSRMGGNLLLLHFFLEIHAKQTHVW